MPRSHRCSEEESGPVCLTLFTTGLCWLPGTLPGSVHLDPSPFPAPLRFLPVSASLASSMSISHRRQCHAQSHGRADHGSTEPSCSASLHSSPVSLSVTATKQSWGRIKRGGLGRADQTGSTAINRLLMKPEGVQVHSRSGCWALSVALATTAGRAGEHAAQVPAEVRGR